jgi:hypothetical protein
MTHNISVVSKDLYLPRECKIEESRGYGTASRPSGISPQAFGYFIEFVAAWKMGYRPESLSDEIKRDPSKMTTQIAVSYSGHVKDRDAFVSALRPHTFETYLTQIRVPDITIEANHMALAKKLSHRRDLGAKADIMTHDTVIDIKVCVKDEPEKWLRQVYAYAALANVNYSEEFSINRLLVINYYTGKAFAIDLSRLHETWARECVELLDDVCDPDRAVAICKSMKDACIGYEATLEYLLARTKALSHHERAGPFFAETLKKFARKTAEDLFKRTNTGTSVTVEVLDIYKQCVYACSIVDMQQLAADFYDLYLQWIVKNINFTGPSVAETVTVFGRVENEFLEELKLIEHFLEPTVSATAWFERHRKELKAKHRDLAHAILKRLGFHMRETDFEAEWKRIDTASAANVPAEALVPPRDEARVPLVPPRQEKVSPSSDSCCCCPGFFSRIKRFFGF